MATALTISEMYRQRTARSAHLAQAARAVLPSGIVSDTRHFLPYGIYVDRAAGTRKWDVDDNEYLDFFGGHGANMLAHCHPQIVAAVQEAAARGTQYAANHPGEVQLAALVQRLVPAAERVRFTGSGTEATLLALRIARAFTNRTRIVRFATHYHGWHDHAASGYVDNFDGGAAPGVLPALAAETILLKPGDLAAWKQALARYGSEIAAVIIEPCGMHFGVVPVQSQFLVTVAADAQAAGALFILDEVLSGFRVAVGGAQSLYGLSPDLSTFAKVLCGGLPGGAVAGKSAPMSVLDLDPAVRGGRGRVMHQGTFTGNPLSMAAGLAMLTILSTSDACQRANELGAYARQRLNEVLVQAGAPLAFYGEFSAFHLFVNPHARRIDPLRFKPEQWTIEEFLARPQPLLTSLRQALNVLGIDVNTKCSGLLSAMHTRAEIDELAGALQEALALLRNEGILRC